MRLVPCWCRTVAASGGKGYHKKSTLFIIIQRQRIAVHETNWQSLTRSLLQLIFARPHRETIRCNVFFCIELYRSSGRPVIAKRAWRTESISFFIHVIDFRSIHVGYHRNQFQLKSKLRKKNSLQQKELLHNGNVHAIVIWATKKLMHRKVTRFSA